MSVAKWTIAGSIVSILALFLATLMHYDNKCQDLLARHLELEDRIEEASRFFDGRMTGLTLQLRVPFGV